MILSFTTLLTVVVLLFVCTLPEICDAFDAPKNENTGKKKCTKLGTGSFGRIAFVC